MTDTDTTEGTATWHCYQCKKKVPANQIHTCDRSPGWYQERCAQLERDRDQRERHIQYLEGRLNESRARETTWRSAYERLVDRQARFSLVSWGGKRD